MEGSGDNRERRTGVLLGVLATLVVALGVALGIVIASDDGGGGSDDPDVTAPTAAPTATATVTQPPPTIATTTTPAAPTITQGQAKAAAARGASDEIRGAGIEIPPEDWDVRCTAQGGAARAERWTCQAASSGGQCAGTIVAIALEPNVGATREPRIGCGE